MTRRIDLGGTWDFVADLDPKYHLDTSIYPSPEYARPTANRRHWLRVPVPGVWQRYAERYDLFEGVCWFAREFSVPEIDAAAPARIRFGAVNYLCRVFVNGEEAGGHEGGYTEFTVDVTGRLRRGVNHIAVMVDNRATSIAWPPCLGYFNYGGIHRQVGLEILDGPSIDRMDLTTTWEGGRGVLTVRATIARGRRGELELEVACGDARAEGAVDPTGEAEVRLEVPGAEPWSPQSPALRHVRVRLVEGGVERAAVERDAVERDVGFKSVEVREGGVFLNGARIRLNGICYVFDSPTRGLVMDPADVDADVALMKEMGCTAVRCHYPMAEIFYVACDRHGLLVWIEPPVYCYHPPAASCPSGFSDPRWRALAESTVREMIRAARSHPCVAIYGIGNECNTAHPEAEAFFRGLAELVRREDPTRLVSYAALYGLVGPVAGLVDVLGVNSYWGWYDKVFGGKGLAPGAAAAGGAVEREPIDLGEMRSMIDTVIANAPPRLALLLTEFGADSVPGARAASRDLWSEDYHAELLTEVFALSKEYPQIVGTFPFCFSDYRDPSKVQNGYWDELNLKGMVDYGRRKKLAFGAVRASYRVELP